MGLNIRDIARIAGVTPGTVSKVLNNYPDISEATRQHVLEVIEENQYDPKAKLKASKSAQEPTRVCMVVESVYNEVYELMTVALSKDLHNAGYCIASFQDNYYIQDKREKFDELLAYLERDKISGLIYIGGNFEPVEPERLEKLPCPTIFVNTVLPRHTRNSGYSSIQTNHLEAGLAQMRFLLEQGHREICTVISSGDDISVYGLRQDAYRAALSQAGLTRSLSRFLECRYMPDMAYRELKDLLLREPEITAVCCQADVMIPGILRAIHDAGRVPGKDVAVVSFDGLESTAYCIPSVTTFAQPYAEMASYTFQLMLGLLSGEREHQQLTFGAKFIRRESC